MILDTGISVTDPGRVTVNEGGMMLCFGIICAVGVAVFGTVIGQRGTWLTVKGSTEKVVVTVYTVPPELERTDVTNGGHEMIDVSPRGYGGKTIVQGGLQATEGALLCHILGGIKTSPVPFPAV